MCDSIPGQRTVFSPAESLSLSCLGQISSRRAWASPALPSASCFLPEVNNDSLRWQHSMLTGGQNYLHIGQIDIPVSCPHRLWWCWGPPSSERWWWSASPPWTAGWSPWHCNIFIYIYIYIDIYIHEKYFSLQNIYQLVLDENRVYIWGSRFRVSRFLLLHNNMTDFKKLKTLRLVFVKWFAV